MAKTPATPLHEQLGFDLVLLARLYRRELDAALRGHGLSEANTLPLRYLGRHGPRLRPGALAQALDLEGPSLIRVLDQLEARGYVRREADPSDGRATLVALTATGVALDKRLAVDLARLRRRIFAGIGTSDLQTCRRAFAAMSANLRRAADGARD